MTLRFCNSHPANITAAIAFWSASCGNGGEWRSMGWYNIAPNQCREVHRADVSDVNQFWYYYAESADNRVWRGDYRFAVTRPNRFDICEGTTHSEMISLGFRELDVGDSDDFTLTFTT